jgi:hypothetical protein
MRARIGALMAGFVCIVAPSALAAAMLTPDQVKQTFATGHPFAASNPGGVKFSITFNGDGTATEIVKGGTKSESGKWRLSDKGYCTQWGTNTEHCYRVTKADDHYDVIGFDGTVIARWTP